MRTFTKITLGALGAVAIVAAGAAGFLAIRAAQADADIAREYETMPAPPAIDPGATKTLRILPLVDEAAGRDDLRIEHGVSYLIQTDDTTILMDVGQNAQATSPSPLEHNMQQLGVTLDDFDLLFFSHLHPDHVGGRAWWQADTFSLGNQQVDLNGKTVYAPAPMTYPGLSPIVVREPVAIADGVASLGALPFVEVFPLSIFMPRNVEQVLAVNVEGKGVVLITGCGHPGLPRMIARAEALFRQPVVGVIGGLHYETTDVASLQPGIDMLGALDMQIVALSPHDSTSQAIEAFRQAFPASHREIAVGQEIVIGD